MIFTLDYETLASVLLRDYCKEHDLPMGTNARINVPPLRDLRDDSFGGLEVTIEILTSETGEPNVNVN